MDSFLQTSKLTTFGKDKVWQKPYLSDPNSSTKNWSYFCSHVTETALYGAKRDDQQETPSK